MPFKTFKPTYNLFGVGFGAKGSKQATSLPSPPCARVAVSEQRNNTPWSSLQNAVDADDVHVRLMFDEAGSIITCKAEPVERVGAQPIHTKESSSGVGPHPAILHTHSAHTFYTIDLSEGKEGAFIMRTLSTATLGQSAPASPALSGASTLVDEDHSPKQGALDTSNFEAIRVLGRGAQGVVTLVKNKATGYHHALKIISVAKLKAISYLHTFEEQAILKRLAGIPWFIDLQGSFYDTKHFFLLTSFHRNGSLASLLHRSRPSPAETRRLAAELVFALGLLREKRVVHGDIKPDNLLLDHRGHLVVADFGLARSFDQPSARAPWRELRYALEQAGFVEPTNLEFERADATSRAVGTPVYAAPEVWCEAVAPPSYSADIWSAGVTIYEMLTGRLPFGPHSKYLPAPERCYATVRKSLTFPGEPDVHVDDDARDLLYKMMEVDASKRPTIAVIKKHPYFETINWLEIAMRDAPVTTPLPGIEEPVKDETAFIPAPAPFDEDDDEDRDPWSWFSWVSPTINSPSEDVYHAVDSAVDVPATTGRAVFPSVEQAAKPSCSVNTIPHTFGTFWEAFKRKLPFSV